MKKHDLDKTVVTKIELSGVIATTYSIPPSSVVSFVEGSFFQGKFIHKQTLYNNDLIPKQIYISTSGKLSLIAVKSELVKIVKASKRASINYIKSEIEKEAIAEVLAELEAEEMERLKKKILMDNIKIEAEREALAEIAAAEAEKDKSEGAALEAARNTLPESELASSSKQLIKLEARSTSLSAQTGNQKFLSSRALEEHPAHQVLTTKESTEVIIGAEIIGDYLDISTGG